MPVLREDTTTVAQRGRGCRLGKLGTPWRLRRYNSVLRSNLLIPTVSVGREERRVGADSMSMANSACAMMGRETTREGGRRTCSRRSRWGARPCSRTTYGEVGLRAEDEADTDES
jgi:hypothetical protein